MPKESQFKSKMTFAERKSEVDKIRFVGSSCFLTFIHSSSIRRKSPDRIPVICEKSEQSHIQGLFLLFIHFIELTYYQLYCISFFTLTLTSRNATKEVCFHFNAFYVYLLIFFRFLVQQTITVGEFLSIIRKNIKVWFFHFYAFILVHFSPFDL